MSDTARNMGIEQVLIDLKWQVQAYSILTASLVGINLWELVTHFPAEVRYIFWPELKALLRDKKWPPTENVLLFNARMLAIPIAGLSFQMIAPAAARIGIITANHNTLYQAYNYCFSAAIYNGTAIFVTRTLTIRDSGRPMAKFLSCCYSVVCIPPLIYAGLVKKPTDFLTNHPVPSPATQHLPLLLFVGCTIAFDTLVLALILTPQLEGLKWKPKKSQTAHRFHLEAIVNLGPTLVVSTFTFIWLLYHRTDWIKVAMTTPIQMWLAITISPRVIRNFRLHTAKQKTSCSPDYTPVSSKIRSPFATDFESLPHTAHFGCQVGHTPSAVFVISKERTTHYPSSLYSDPGRAPFF